MAVKKAKIIRGWSTAANIPAPPYHHKRFKFQPGDILEKEEEEREDIVKITRGNKEIYKIKTWIGWLDFLCCHLTDDIQPIEEDVWL